MVGDGIATFGVLPVCSATYRKSSTWIVRAWRSLPVTEIFGGVMCTVSREFELDSIMPDTVTPSSCWRKSRWNHSRRNSPSVMLWIPVASSFGIISAIAVSSMPRSSASSISPRARRPRATWIAGGRSRLPT